MIDGRIGLPQIYGRAWLISTLSRVTSSGEYVAEIDGLRCLAVIMVIAHHAMASYLTLTARLGNIHLPSGWYEVGQRGRLVRLISHFDFALSVFFVISGFILALPFARASLYGGAAISLRKYYLRRLTRLEPPYVINLLICFALIVLPIHHHAVKDYFQAFFPHLLGSLFYLHGLVFADASWINGVAWSLEVEVQFYVLVPLLSAVFWVRSARLRRTVLIASMLIFGLLSQLFLGYSGPMRLRLSLVNYLAYFLAGFLMADLYLEHWRMKSPRSLAWDAIAMASPVSIFAILLKYPQATFAVPFLVLALYAAVFGGPVSNAMVRWKPLTLIGGMCYTIYLYHFLLIDWLFPVTLTWSSNARPLWLDFAIQFAIACVVILPVCAILFVWIEKPFMGRIRS